MLNEMSYENLVLPSLEMAVNLYKKLNISLEHIIVHTDNGMQYYAKDFLNYLDKYQMKPSKKQPNKFGGNALSKNWFYHISVEWIRERVYETFGEAKQDIEEYIQFYNYERIHSKWNDIPMNYLV